MFHGLFENKTYLKQIWQDTISLTSNDIYNKHKITKNTFSKKICLQTKCLQKQ